MTPAIKFTDRAALGGKAKTVDGYKCGDCGEPKKGHVCQLGDGPDGQGMPMGDQIFRDMQVSTTLRSATVTL